MAEKGKTTHINLDGNELVRHLTKAGLDPKKLDLREVLGRGEPGLDIAELESRLHAAGSRTALSWEVTVTVKVASR